jgi:DNA/RNA-binding domain of Phe-tRNA-synthetase-like protein
MKHSYIMQPEFRALGFASCIVCEIHGIVIPEAADELERMKNETLPKVLELESAALYDDPVLTGYRSQVASIGRSAKKFPPAAESLIQLIRRTGRFPAINVAVDAYNVTVCQTRLALGVHDLDRLSGAITFRTSSGGEAFRAVGSDMVKRTAPGDYLYADETKVLAWLDSKDSDEVKLGRDTENVLIVVQGTSVTSRTQTRAGIEDAARKIVMLCGGTFEVAEIV